MPAKVIGIVGASVATVSLLSGCTGDDEPKLDEVAQKFEADASHAFAELSDTYAANPDSAKIDQDGSEDIECDDGNVKRRFAGSFALMESAEVDDTLDLIRGGISSSFTNSRGYELDKLPPSDSMVREFTLTNEDRTITFEVRAVGEPTPTLTMRGNTGCLAP